MARFGRVVTAMVTPFGADGGLDVDAAARLAQWLIETGSDGLVLAGTTGESPTLDGGELEALVKSVRSAVDVPILVGTGGNNTSATVELTRRMNDCGADGVLCVSPYYNRPSQTGLIAHFEAVAAASTLPVVLYDVPTRTGRRLEVSTTVALSAVPNIVAIKDAGGRPTASAEIVDATPDDFELYSGDDALTLPLLAVGAVGVVSVCSHWAGVPMGLMIDAFERGDHAEARRHNAQMFESYAFAASDEAPNPVPTKAMMRVLGHPVGECRPPMGPTPDGLEERARKVLAGLR